MFAGLYVKALDANRALIAESTRLQEANSQLALATQRITDLQAAQEEPSATQAAPFAPAPGAPLVGATSPKGDLRVEPVPYGELPLAFGRVDALREFLTRLGQQSFTGIVKATAYRGRFCLSGNATEGYALATEDLPAGKCDLIGNPFDGALNSAQRQSLAFANLASSARQRTQGAISVIVNDEPAETRVVAPYPAPRKRDGGTMERDRGSEQSSGIYGGSHCPFSMTEFTPRPWLRNAHLQSILPSLPLRRSAIERRALSLLQSSVEEVLDCGEGVRLLGLHSSQERRGRVPAAQLVVLHHGWEGSAQSLYVLALGQFLFERGFDVLRLNLRDHGPTHHLNRDLFHSCRIKEVVGAVRRIQSLYPAQRLSLVGFSLGGNFALRVGAGAREAGIDLHRIVAISPVLDPEVTLAALEDGVAIYRQYFIRKWTRSLLKKQLAWPEVYDFRELLRDRTLTAMTDYLVCHHSEFPDLQTYLRGYALVHGALEPLCTLSRIIAATDDPMIPSRDLERLPRLANLRITPTRFGGHCGFMPSWRGDSWIAGEVLSELNEPGLKPHRPGTAAPMLTARASSHRARQRSARATADLLSAQTAGPLSPTRHSIG